LKFNDHLKELEDKNRMKVDIRLLRENRAQPENYRLRALLHPNQLRQPHAKCYLNQDLIVTSLNLHDFTQVNSEMGILIVRDDDPAFRSGQRRSAAAHPVSDEVRVSFEKVKRVSEDNAPNGEEELKAPVNPAPRLAKKFGSRRRS
jgi:hypothetical protein